MSVLKFVIQSDRAHLTNPIELNVELDKFQFDPVEQEKRNLDNIPSRKHQNF